MFFSPHNKWWSSKGPVTQFCISIKQVTPSNNICVCYALALCRTFLPFFLHVMIQQYPLFQWRYISKFLHLNWTSHVNFTAMTLRREHMQYNVTLTFGRWRCLLTRYSLTVLNHTTIISPRVTATVSAITTIHKVPVPPEPAYCHNGSAWKPLSAKLREWNFYGSTTLTKLWTNPQGNNALSLWTVQVQATYTTQPHHFETI